MADSGLRSRNLTEARQAYASGDAAASLRAHSTPSPVTMEGGHSTSYNDVSMAVVSGVYKQATKGTLFSLVLLSALSQLDIPSKRLLVTIFSIAVSSGFVVYFLSSMDHSVEVTVYDRERKREAWELENYRKGEIDEIIELFETRGVEHNDAVLVVNKMAKYDNFFVDLMMAEELQISKPLPVNQTPYRFILEGLSFAVATFVPSATAVAVQEIVGGMSVVVYCWCVVVLLLGWYLHKTLTLHHLKSYALPGFYFSLALAACAVVHLIFQPNMFWPDSITISSCIKHCFSAA